MAAAITFALSLLSSFPFCVMGHHVGRLVPANNTDFCVDLDHEESANGMLVYLRVHWTDQNQVWKLRKIE